MVFRDNTIDGLLNGVSGEKSSTLNPGGGAEGYAGPILLRARREGRLLNNGTSLIAHYGLIVKFSDTYRSQQLRTGKDDGSMC